MVLFWFLTLLIKKVGMGLNKFGMTWLKKEYPMPTICCWEAKKI